MSVTKDRRLIEAEKEFERALQGGKEEAMVYWFGYRNGVKWAVEQEQRSKEEII